jgi:protein-tyrosine kinase
MMQNNLKAIDSETVNVNRSIGAILIDSGKISLSDAEQILQMQRQENLRFGDAAIKLGLITPDDFQFALAKQFDYPYLLKGESAIGDELIAAFQPFCAQVESLRALRSQLMLRCFTGDDKRKSLAIVSPERGEGRSFIASNLAVVFSQLGAHTLLIDADMRNPSQHRIFNLQNRIGLSSVLAERAGVEAIQRVTDLQDLSVLTSGAIPPNPQELIGRPVFARFLQELENEFEVILIDTPPCAEFADAHTMAVRSGAALFLARKNHTRSALMRDQAELMQNAGVQVVGSIFNVINE